MTLNIVTLPDPGGTADVQEVTRNYGGESCFTEVDHRQYAFGSNNTSLEGFYRELQFELEHEPLQTSLADRSDGPGGIPVYAAAESSSKDVPMSRPVGIPNILAQGHETMSVTWALKATGAASDRARALPESMWAE